VVSVRTLTRVRPAARPVGPAVADLAPALGLDRGDRSVARCVEVRPGPWEVGAVATEARHLLLLVEGTLLRSVRIGVREGAELLGPGDPLCLEPDDNPAFRTTLRAMTPCRIAVLDERVLSAAAARPALCAALFAAVSRRTAAIAGQVAITQHTSIDERLRLLLPALAARWGVVTPDGVLLPAFLSHAVLAALIGVRRPSLTAALGGLVESALLVRLPDRRWRVAHEIGVLG